MPKQTQRKLDKLVKKLRSKISRFYKENPQSLLNHKQIAARIKLGDALEKQMLIPVIEAMVKEELLTEEQRGKYRWSGPLNELEGLISFNRSGNAFVEVAGFSKDIMIPEQYTDKALHGDRVVVRLLSGTKGRPKGKVISISERARTSFAALIFTHGNKYYALPDNPRISVDFYIPNENLNGAEEGDKVVVSLIEWENMRKYPLAEVTDVLGKPGDMKAEGDSILAEFGFPLQFPADVEAECNEIDVSISESEVKKRRDFRKTLTFTIDPADAKDFDDAISFKTLENGHFEVGVHIADVTHYVRPGTRLEEEALNRATSVYLVDRVIPMLPEMLSNKVCSLRPHEEKYTFSVVFEMDEAGKVYDTWIGKTVIYSDHRFEYEEVQDILEQGKGLYHTELNTLNTMAKTLRAERMRKGSIAFDKAEVRFKLDEDRKPTDVFFKVQKDAHKLIEEFMLMANKAVAMKVGHKSKPDDVIKTFVYRVHDEPDPAKLNEFAAFVKRFGYKIDFNNPAKTASTINGILKLVKGKPEQNIVDMLAIRSMAKAEYSTENVGHFGLSFPFYSHFTSPIRRYPDMIAHRLLYSYLDGGKSANAKDIDRACKHSGLMERKAIEAERESTKLYQVIYMHDFIGDIFDGVITGMTDWGVFVEMSANKCEGMVRLRDIEGDFYFYDQQNMQLVGQRSKTTLQLGEKVQVKIEAADIQNRRIDLKIIH